MKKLILFGLGWLLLLQTHAQVNNDIYGIVRKNYFSNVVDPLDSNNVFEQLDSATIRLGMIDPSTGYVTNLGPVAYTDAVNLTGAALNPYTQSYIFIGATNIQTLDLNNGTMVNSVPLSNPIQDSYFDNFRFNNSDSTLYGLARRNTYDPITMTNFGEVFLAKTNTNTGVITQISPTSVAQGFALAGSAIDPYQMVYYFSTGSNLLGLDLYNGNIYTNVPINNPYGIAFDNFTYSCADSTIYGLIRQNYFSYYTDSLLPGVVFQTLDSSTVKLGKINPNTGLVTLISPSTLTYGGYSLNASSTIDPNTMTYYYSTGYQMVGVSLNTGLVTSAETYTFENGQYFELMRNFQNCIAARAIRANPGQVGMDELPGSSAVNIYPNPSTDIVNISGQDVISQLELVTVSGQLVYSNSAAAQNFQMDVSGLNPGMYLLKISMGGKTEIHKILKL
jgi:hypothetical protein